LNEIKLVSKKRKVNAPLKEMRYVKKSRYLFMNSRGVRNTIRKIVVDRIQISKKRILKIFIWLQVKSQNPENKLQNGIGWERLVYLLALLK
jgi:hypothetical protein